MNSIVLSIPPVLRKAQPFLLRMCDLYNANSTESVMTLERYRDQLGVQYVNEYVPMITSKEAWDEGSAVQACQRAQKLLIADLDRIYTEVLG